MPLNHGKPSCSIVIITMVTVSIKSPKVQKKKAPQKLVGWSRYMEGWQAGIGHFLRVKVLPGSDVRGKDKKNQELTKSGHF
jgi:hypothetical protein